MIDATKSGFIPVDYYEAWDDVNKANYYTDEALRRARARKDILPSKGRSAASRRSRGAANRRSAHANAAMGEEKWISGDERQFTSDGSRHKPMGGRMRSRSASPKSGTSINERYVNAPRNRDRARAPVGGIPPIQKAFDDGYDDGFEAGMAYAYKDVEGGEENHEDVDIYVEDIETDGEPSEKAYVSRSEFNTLVDAMTDFVETTKYEMANKEDREPDPEGERTVLPDGDSEQPSDEEDTDAEEDEVNIAKSERPSLVSNDYVDSNSVGMNPILEDIRKGGLSLSDVAKKINNREYEGL